MKLKKWQYLIVMISLILMFGNKCFPAFGGLNQIGVSTISIFGGAMLLLILVDITWPVLLTVSAFAISDVYSFADAVKMSFGHHIFWFVVLVTTLLSVLAKSGMLKRIAVWIITRPIVKKNPWFLLIALIAAELFLGAFMNCTVIIMLFCGLLEQIFEAVGIKKGNRTGELIMMAMLVFCGISYGFTPFGHPVPILSIEMFEELYAVNYIQYVLVSLLVSILFMAFFLLVMKFVFKIDMEAFRDFNVDTLREGMGPVSKEEKIGGGIFLLVILWWVMPGIIQNMLPEIYTFMDKVGYCMPVLIAVAVMALIPVNGKPMLNFEKALSDGSTSWAAGFPMAAAMLLSSALTNEEAGITQFISDVVGSRLGNMSGWMFAAIIGLVCALLTNVSSDTVSVMLCGAIAVSLINSGAIIGVNPGALCIALGNSACLAFATPAGSTYGAVMAGTGWIARKSQFSQGFLFSLLAGLLFSTVGYGIGCMMF